MNKKVLLLAPILALVMSGCDRGSRPGPSSSSHESSQTSESSGAQSSSESGKTSSTSSQSSSEKTSSSEQQSSSQQSSSSSSSSEQQSSSQQQSSSEQQSSSSEQQSSSSEQQSSSQQEQEVTYSIRIGQGSELIVFTLSQTASLAQNQKAQYEATATNLQKGDLVAFYADGYMIEENIGSEPEDETNKNLIQTGEEHFYIYNDAEQSTIYFKTWEDGGYSFWATGYQADVPDPDVPEEDGYYLVGTKTNWKYEGAIKMDAGEQNDDLAQLIKYEATAGEAFKVRSYFEGTDTWYQFADIVPTEDNPDANYIVAEDGELDIYLNKEGVIYVFDHTDPLPDATYYVQIGEADPVELAKDEEYSLAENQKAQYEVALTELKEGDKVTFYAGEEAITEKIGSEPEDEENKNLIQTVEGEFIINNDADESTIYFKTWNDGGYSFWATGYDAGELPEPDVPEEDGYYLVGTKTNWKFAGATKMEAGAQNDDLAQLIGYEATEGEQIKVRSYFEGTDTWYQFAEITPTEDNPDANYIVAKDCKLDIYLNKDGAAYVFPQVEPGETMTLTVTNFPSDKTAEHYAIHAWGGAAAAQNYDATLVGTTLTAEVPNDITGFLVASYNGTFDWNSLVYKSADFTVVEGQTEYALPDPAADITLKIISIAAPYTAASYDLYIYFWGSTEPTAFVKGEVTEDYMEADVPNDITGFLVLVMLHDYTPGWAGTTGFVGQSNDYPYQVGTTSYSWIGLK